MTINLIAAVANNLAIGVNGELIYHIPEDMRRFKELTTGHPIIMGRKTFESLPHGALPGRRNIILTKQPVWYSGAECYSAFDDALFSCSFDDDVFIIGGASVYKQFMYMANQLYMTEVDDNPTDADAFFPEYKNTNEWIEVSREYHAADDRHLFNYSFVEYSRRKK